ncbi:hypothetical protein B0J12DRAFT_698216 [Macrophomina phaseolina]|uniref:Armadillo-like helical n=1 Tax=Macrophomina phaseolina TaxID=35725 RepID=A0ABQ8GGL2_9PEZI|nr:hypothetical protein B0J12DRAFT_698216 [Macrophomina phaseolina]
MSALRDELDAARKFLAPAWERGNDDIVVRLSNNAELSRTSDAHKDVLLTASNHLLRIHEADIVHQQYAPSNAEGEYDEDSRKTLYGLLDLVATRGILPSLSPGIATKHRPRSMIPDLRESTPNGAGDIEILREIISTLSKIYEDPTAGLAPLIRERILADVVAGAGELAFSPGLEDHIHSTKDEKVFVDLINKTPVSSAMPLLTYLLQPTTPPWLKIELSKQLSLIPLRPGGVRHAIEFIASSYPQTQQQMEPHDRTKGPALPLDALNQACRLLSSVPSSMGAESYFTVLAPQLLSMLDGDEGPELSKAAALIIGNGILGKRAIGAPGTVGWRLFAEPLLNNIGPSADQISRKAKNQISSQSIVVEQDLKAALSRLTTLLMSHPSPGLTKRLVGRLMLPLWSLLNYAKNHPVDHFWRDASWKLLETFFRLGAGAEQLEMLAMNLLWDGPPAWIYAPGSEGGVEMGKVEQRIASYQDILSANGVEDQDIGELFVRLSRRWLAPRSLAAGAPFRLETSSEEDPLQSLIIAKLVMAMLEKYKDKLAADPDNMIELVKQLLDEWAESNKTMKKHSEDLRKATYAGLSNIVQQKSQNDRAQEEPDALAEVDSNEVLPVALSLLNTLISAPKFRPTTRTSATLSSVLPTLESLRNPDPGSDLPPSVSMAAANLTNIISNLLHIPHPPSTTATTTNPSSTTSDKALLTTALTDLTSPHAPLRASALSAITTLTTARSPAIDIPQLTLLLLRTALPDPDEYVHLHALKTLAALASRDVRLVAGKLLLDAFVDAGEEGGLETRLRVGEVLGRVVEDMRRGGGVSDGLGVSSSDVARTVVQKIAGAMAAVASRRGNRAKEMKARERAARLEERKRRDAERAWGGEVPVDPRLLGEEEEESEQDKRDAAMLLGIVEGWSDTGLEEDVRLRALALSVFTTVVEEPGTLACLQRETVEAGVDVAVSSLVLEVDETHAILRRAAVLVVYGLVKALDKVHDEGGQVTEGAWLAPSKWEQIESVVGWVRDQDGDAIVKGHAAEVLEALETWRMKKALGVKGDGTLAGHITDDLGLGGLRGLSVNVGSGQPASREGGRKLVIEEVE